MTSGSSPRFRDGRIIAPYWSTGRYPLASKNYRATHQWICRRNVGIGASVHVYGREDNKSNFNCLLFIILNRSRRHWAAKHVDGAEPSFCLITYINNFLNHEPLSSAVNTGFCDVCRWARSIFPEQPLSLEWQAIRLTQKITPCPERSGLFTGANSIHCSPCPARSLEMVLGIPNSHAYCSACQV